MFAISTPAFILWDVMEETDALKLKWSLPVSCCSLSWRELRLLPDSSGWQSGKPLRWRTCSGRWGRSPVRTTSRRSTRPERASGWCCISTSRGGFFQQSPALRAVWQENNQNHWCRSPACQKDIHVFFFFTLPSQHPSVHPHQPTPELTGPEVPSDQVPEVHLHHLHPQLPRPEPAHHLRLLRGRDEGPVHRSSGVWRHEPQSWR